MICSFSKGFLFIKTKKTGGTSVEIALSRFCADGDIITPISPGDEIERLGTGKIAQNYGSNFASELTYRGLVRLGREELLRWYVVWERPRRRFFNHMSLETVLTQIPTDALKNLRSFTIERHPFEKVVSWAYFRLGSQPRKALTMSRTLDAVIAEKTYINFPLYTLNGRVAVDRVLRYEHLAEEFSAFLRELSLEAPPELPNAKGQYRSNRTPAREVLSDEQKSKIYQDARFEFEQFGYLPE